MSNLHFEVAGIIDRKQEFRQRAPTAYVRQRIAEAAADLSLAGELAARVELANEALCRLVELLYQADTDGTWANVDGVTFRILLPLPWGSAGWKRWGLRYHEAILLRSILLGRMTHPRTPPLFGYNTELRTWHLSANEYPAIEHASRYLERHPVLLSEWRGVLSTYRQGRVNVVSGRRQRSDVVSSR